MNEVKTPKKPLIVYYAIAILVVLLINTLLVPMVSQARVKYVDYGTFIQMTEEDKISEVQVQDNQIVFITKEDEANKNAVYYRTGKMDDPELTSRLSEHGVRFDKEIVEETSPLLSFLLSFVFPIVLFIALGQLLTRQMMKRMGGGKDAMSFGMGNSNAKVYVKDSAGSIKFDDVAGEDEAKENLSEIVNYLHDPSKYRDIGASMPKGILLVGPPGTGKTMLAKAVAGEANVPFFSISGSEFVEMFVGMGASKVRDLFKQAKEKAPCIVFIDEIDAIGKKRDGGKFGGGNDEREQTLNQLLTEMDGFEGSNGVIILAATNRPESLDPALTRPGRFDRQGMVGYPDVRGREDILRVHAKGKPLAPDVDLSTIAKSPAGFTGADLENLLNEAALLAARKDHKSITMEEIEEATIKVVVGTEKKSHKMSSKEKKLTAYHEAGHAVATFFLESQDPVHQISIIPRGMAGGYTMSMPKEDKSYTSKNDMLDELVVLLGGRVAESLILGDISTGASNDIERATEIARKMVTKYGMSEALGPIAFGSGNDEVFLGRDFSHTRNYSENVASEIDEEINRIIVNAYNRCRSILEEHQDKLHKVAHYLYNHEKVDGDLFKELMTNDALEIEPMVEADALSEQEESPAAEANAPDQIGQNAESAEEQSPQND